MEPTKPDLAPASIEPREGARWFVVRARSRAEKQIAAHCKQRELGEVYIPLIRSVRRYEKSIRTSYIPMLPGYVFACMSDVHRRALISDCTACCGYLDTNDQTEERLIQDLQELRALELAQEQGELIVRPSIVSGTKIEIKHGPFRGVMGVVKTRRGKTRIIVNVNLIGNSVALEVNIDEVTPEPS